MALNLNSAVIEIVTRDLSRSLDFYRLLGLAVPQPDGPHVEVALPGGNRLAFDTSPRPRRYPRHHAVESGNGRATTRHVDRRAGARGHA